MPHKQIVFVSNYLLWLSLRREDVIVPEMDFAKVFTLERSDT